MTGRHPCPCCGHLTLLTPPGSYDLCPVCDWEDDVEGLRYPLRAVGPNGLSLHDAQRAHARRHHGLRRGPSRGRRRGRRPRPDEPLEEGWRPFDPDRDWTDPRLESDTWPVNPAALYWWRPTWWAGDQHALPAAPREPDGHDRLSAHVREEVPEVEPLLTDDLRRFGRARPHEVARAAARVAVEAYRRGDTALGDRVARAVAPGLDEASTLWAWSFVAVGFLEEPDWRDPALRPVLERWPEPLRGATLAGVDHAETAATDLEHHQEQWHELWRTAAGQPVPLLAARLRDLSPPGALERLELHLEATARVMSDPHWLRHHPVDSWRMAWRHRAEQSPWRTLRWLARPRFAG